MNESKLSIAQLHYMDGNKIEALKIVAKFKNLGNDKHRIQLGYDAYAHEDFYKQIKKNVNEIIEDGIRAMEERYGW